MIFDSPSHLNGQVFGWKHFPRRFCEAYLPNEDTMIVLEDEKGKSYETKYLAHKAGLSAGWRRFSIDYKIMEGDVLIFSFSRTCQIRNFMNLHLEYTIA